MTISNNDSAECFKLTLVTSLGKDLNKSYKLQHDRITKTSNADLLHGEYKVLDVPDPQQLLTIIESLSSKQAFISGVPVDAYAEPLLNGVIMSNSRKSNSCDANLKDVITRTKVNVVNGQQKGYFIPSNCFLIDVDATQLSINETLEVLYRIDPNLRNAPLLGTQSSSYGIKRESDSDLSPGGSYHFHVGSVKNHHDIERYSEVFCKRLWLAGYGHIVISESGKFLVRQLVDKAPFDHGRLMYEACPTLGKGIIQKRLPPIVQQGNGELFDTEVLLDLSELEELEYQRLVANSKLEVEGERQVVADNWIRKRVEQMVEAGADNTVATKVLKASISNGILYGDMQVKTDTKGILFIRELITNGAELDQITMADPFEWEYGGGVNKAKFFWNDGKPYINSMAHGQHHFKLELESSENDTEVLLKKRVKEVVEAGSLTASNIEETIVELCGEFSLNPTLESILIDIVIHELNLKGMKGAIKEGLKRVRNEKRKQRRAVIGTDVKVQQDISIPLSEDTLPDVSATGVPLATEGNLRAILAGYGLRCDYDVINKKQAINFNSESHDFCSDLEDNAALLRVRSLCELNGLPPRTVDHLMIMFAENSMNPVIDYIRKTEWDGHDHIQDLIAMVKVDEKSKELFTKFAMKRWLIQCIAAADNAKNSGCLRAQPKFEYCLVFVGVQGIAKTSFFYNLVPEELKRYFGGGVALQVSNKDSVMQAVSHWIVELGEIDATKKLTDIAMLKAFLSRMVDIIRLPYDKAASTLQRRTSFCGSVNANKFLSDSTGSRRFWPIHVTALPKELPEDFDVSQMWAQVWDEYLKGAIWWDEDGMRALVDKAGKEHANDNYIRDMILDKFDLEAPEDKGLFLSRTSISSRLDVPPNGAIAREITNLMNEYGIRERKIRGVNGYKLTMRDEMDVLFD